MNLFNITFKLPIQTAEAEYDHESLALQKMRDLGFPMEGEEEEYIE